MFQFCFNLHYSYTQDQVSVCCHHGYQVVNNSFHSHDHHESGSWNVISVSSPIGTDTELQGVSKGILS